MYEEGDFVFIKKLSLFSIGTINLPIVENFKTQPIFEFELIKFISKSFPLHIKLFDFVNSQKCVNYLRTSYYPKIGEMEINH